jgi:hypothetical protein
MNGGSGSKSLGGCVIIESSVDTTTDSNAASLSTPDAGIQGSFVTVGVACCLDWLGLIQSQHDLTGNLLQV